jgi:hypothetical protein
MGLCSVSSVSYWTIQCSDCGVQVIHQSPLLLVSFLLQALTTKKDDRNMVLIHNVKHRKVLRNEDDRKENDYTVCGTVLSSMSINS